jgi:hypothetical protein
MPRLRTANGLNSVTLAVWGFLALWIGEGMLIRMHGDLDKLITFIAEHFKFDKATYPELEGVSDQKRLEFAIRHSVLHFSKTTGKIAAVSEDVDHGGALDLESIKENVPKALINVLRLAELVGISEAEIIRAIEEKYKSKIS